MYEILQIILLSIVTLIVFFFAYIKLKYKFWSIQPVFHFYDFYYWIKNVGIISPELPRKNKYTNFTDIKTLTTQQLSQKQWKDITLFIQINYLRNKENIFFPKLENINNYFFGHRYDSYWSFYYTNNHLHDNKSGKIIKHNKIIGIMSSRPLQCFIKNNNFYLYYVDYLCVDKNHRKKNIAPQIIQTHEYNQSHSNKQISVSLFKREEELTGIIPLTYYNTYCYNFNDFTHINDVQLVPNIRLLTADKQNIYYFYNFIQEIQNKNKTWDIMILPSMSNLCKLIETQNIYIKMLTIDKEIIAAYIFKKTCTALEKNKELLSCICSINSNHLTNNEFIDGFKISVYSIKTFAYLSVENISDNNIIINNFKELFFSPTAYFFYNFAHSPFKANKCLIIN